MIATTCRKSRSRKQEFFACGKRGMAVVPGDSRRFLSAGHSSPELLRQTKPSRTRLSMSGPSTIVADCEFCRCGGWRSGCWRWSPDPARAPRPRRASLARPFPSTGPTPARAPCPPGRQARVRLPPGESPRGARSRALTTTIAAGEQGHTGTRKRLWVVRRVTLDPRVHAGLRVGGYPYKGACSLFVSVPMLAPPELLQAVVLRRVAIPTLLSQREGRNGLGS